MHRYIPLIIVLSLPALSGCARDSNSQVNALQATKPQVGDEGLSGELAADRGRIGSLVWHKLHAGDRPGLDAPTGGEACAMACDTTNNRVFVYGGKTSDDRNTNELWSFEVKSRRWSQIRSDGPLPPARRGHTLVLDKTNNALVLFGGEDEDGRASHETWLFDLAQNRWQHITHDSAPFRQDHVAVYDPRGKRMVLFGGRNEERSVCADSWALNLNRNSSSFGAWSQCATGETKPSARSEHGGTYDRLGHRLLVFGGRQTDKKSYLNDVWALDLAAERWTPLQTHGDIPYPVIRSAVSVNPDTNELMAFGGEFLIAKGSDRELHVINTVSILNLTALTWTHGRSYPPPMYDHAGVFVPEYGGLLVYGGSSHRPQKEHATWLFKSPDDSAVQGAESNGAGSGTDPRRAAWHQVHSGARVGEDTPVAGEDGAIAYDGTRHCVFLYGGKGDNDLNTNQLWAFDLEKRRWSQITSEGNQPPPREDHSIIFDRANDSLVLYGGEDGPTSHETWVFDLRRSRWQNITHRSAPFRQSHKAIYDPKTKRMVVFGGAGDDKALAGSDTLTLNLDSGSADYGSWSVMSTGDPKPLPRTQHAAAYDSVRHRLLVFGGSARTKGKKQNLNDVWTLDLVTSQWTEIKTSGDAPPPIVQSVAGYDPTANELYVFAGEAIMGDRRRNEYLVNNLWVLNLNDLTWTDRSPYPPPMRDHSSVFVSENGGALVYGGRSARGVEHSSWLLKPSGSTTPTFAREP